MADAEELERFLRQPNYLYAGEVKDYGKRDWSRTNLLAALTRKAFVAKAVETEQPIVSAVTPREIDAAFLKLCQIKGQTKEMVSKMREFLVSKVSGHNGQFSYRRLIPAMQKGKDTAMAQVRARDEFVLKRSPPEMAFIAAANNAVNAIVKLGYADYFAERMFPKYMRPGAVHQCKPHAWNMSTLADYEAECYTLAMALCEWRHPFAMLKFLACDNFRVTDLPQSVLNVNSGRCGPVELVATIVAEGFNNDVSEEGNLAQRMVRHMQEVNRLLGQNAAFDKSVMAFVDSVDRLTKKIALVAIEMIKCIVKMEAAEKDKSALKFITMDTSGLGKYTVKARQLLSGEMPSIYYETMDPMFYDLTLMWEENLALLKTLKTRLLREYGFDKLSFGIEISSYERAYRSYASSRWAMCTNRSVDDIAPSPRLMDLHHEKIYPTKFEEFYFALLAVPFPGRGNMSEADRKKLQERLQMEPTNKTLAIYV